jgi:hypothetical protein
MLVNLQGIKLKNIHDAIVRFRISIKIDTLDSINEKIIAELGKCNRDSKLKNSFTLKRLLILVMYDIFNPFTCYLIIYRSRFIKHSKI